jgi:caa(3)-type oxidase subunit IV
MHTPQPSPPPTPDGARKHAVILVCLMAATLVMVTASLLPLGSTALKVTLVLGVAGVEAFLVAGHLMHLLSERRLIYSVLALTAIFIVGLLALPILSQHDHTSRFFH